MEKKIKLLDLHRVHYISLRQKKHKVKKHQFAKAWKQGGTFTDFLSTLPHLLAGKSFHEIVEKIAKAVYQNRMVLLGMGAHPIKVGLNPILIDWMERGILKGIGMNGACLVHDVEMAMIGHTSEEVEEELSRGTFGMVRETHEWINHTISEGVKKGMGIGESIGQKLLSERFPYTHLSLLAAGGRTGVPMTVHIALGTDIYHMGPTADGASLGKGSLKDFQIFASLVSKLNRGVYINLGSAVILPEVFLKALALARNLGNSLKRITTINMDFMDHYRPSMNVVKRPTLMGGKGYTLIGHHELMVPLLAASVIEKLSSLKRQQPEEVHP